MGQERTSASRRWLRSRWTRAIVNVAMLAGAAGWVFTAVAMLLNTIPGLGHVETGDHRGLWKWNASTRGPRVRIVLWGNGLGSPESKQAQVLDEFGRSLPGSGWAAVLAGHRSGATSVGPLTYGGAARDPSSPPTRLDQRAIGAEVDRVAQQDRWPHGPNDLVLVIPQDAHFAEHDWRQQSCGYHLPMQHAGRWYNVSVVPWTSDANCGAGLLTAVERSASHEIAEAAAGPAGMSPRGEIGDPCETYVSMAIGDTGAAPIVVQPIVDDLSGTCQSGRGSLPEGAVWPAEANAASLALARRHALSREALQKAWVPVAPADAAVINSRAFQLRTLHRALRASTAPPRLNVRVAVARELGR